MTAPSGFIGMIGFSVDGLTTQDTDTLDPTNQGVAQKSLNTLDGNRLSNGGGGGGGRGNVEFTASDTPPGSPAAGDEWFDTTSGRQYTWIDDGNSGQWVELESLDGGGARGIKYFAQDTAPDTAIAGDQWLDTSSGIQYVLVDDGDSIQWVEHF